MIDDCTFPVSHLLELTNSLPLCILGTAAPQGRAGFTGGSARYTRGIGTAMSASAWPQPHFTVSRLTLLDTQHPLSQTITMICYSFWSILEDIINVVNQKMRNTSQYTVELPADKLRKTLICLCYDLPCFRKKRIFLLDLNLNMFKYYLWNTFQKAQKCFYLVQFLNKNE